MKIKNKKDIKITLLFTLIGIISGILLGFAQIGLATEEMKAALIEQFGFIEILVPLTAFNTALFTFVSTIFGLKIARKVNLKLNFIYDKRAVILALIVGAVAAILISTFDKFVFLQFLPEQLDKYEFSLIYFIASVLYGGIIEELMVRLFFMSLMVLILRKIFAKSKDVIPNWIYIISIFGATLIFAAGHLPATFELLGNSSPIIIRAFLLNGLAGLGYGYLYWKKGLAYAILAHALTHIINQLMVMPLLSLI